MATQKFQFHLAKSNQHFPAAVCDVVKENVFATNLNCFKGDAHSTGLWVRGVFPGKLQSPIFHLPSSILAGA
jgi:hypothetical protein